MAVVLDSSVVIAALHADDPDHEAVLAWWAGQDDPCVSTPLALCEMDHLLLRFGGTATTAALRRDLLVGAWTVAWWGEALHETVAVADDRPDLGLVDASLVALARRLGTDRIATLDERHFRSLPDGFRLLPADG